MIKSYHCIITGKVQGGNFQSWVLTHAQQLNLTGWVRFLEDGKAEILVQGEADKYMEFKNELNDAPVLDMNARCEVIEYDKTHETFQMRG